MGKQDVIKLISRIFNKFEGTANLSKFGKTVFGIILLGSSRLLEEEAIESFDHIGVTKLIVDAYEANEERFYHNEEHILNMLHYMAEVAPNMSEDDGVALTMAILFHDVVYSYTNKTNEEDSALAFIKAFNLNPDILSKVQSLETINWSTLSMAECIVALILETKKTPWEIRFPVTHPMAIIVNGDYDNFTHYRRAMIARELVKAEATIGFGIDNDKFEEGNMAFYKHIIDKFGDNNDERMTNIKKLYAEISLRG